jgi:signal transduction histidine kinase
MAQRELDLVMMEEAPGAQTSGVWAVSGGDQSGSMAFAVHDAKNMLGALQANVHWLRSNFEEDPSSREEVVQAIEDMDTCCQRLATLLCQALLAARGQQLSTNPSRVHVGALVGHAVHQVKKQALSRGVDVRAAVRADVITMMDGLLVSRLLDNLLNNAISYSRPGCSVVMEYGTDGNDVYFAVSDEGPGISDAVRDRLFEPFVTEKRPTLPEAGFHAGLGLAFCKAVARAHGGDITYTNRASGGAMFVVRLPWIRPNRLSMVPR